MTFSTITDTISRWILLVAGAIVTAAGRLRRPRAVELVEDDSGSFVVQTGRRAETLRIADGQIVGANDAVAALIRGSRAELVLRPDRFLFRPLELPRRAAEFLDGVVRAQIDRLTPWGAADAAFGWSTPAASGTERIVVTVAATARAQVAPLARALAPLAPEEITVSTRAPESEGGAVITVLQQKARTILDIGRVQRVLVVVLAVTCLAAVASATTAVMVGGNLAAQQDDLARRIAQRRAALRAGAEAAGLPSAYHQLEVRKHESPSAVMVLEVLSQLLPDHTYVTELRIEGDKLRVVGVTRDAPSLIRLMEQSNHFSRATFFAPTTRQPSDPGERFHIEARIEPVGGARS